MNNYQEILEFSKELALKAGEIMLKYFKQNMDFETKSDNTPVTIADKEINSLVIDQIQQKFPDHSILGEEESKNTDSDISSKSHKLWICDPIDGTFPYSMGMMMSTFMLAYLEDGISKVAVIYDPFRKLMYSAVEGKGAFRNDKQIHVNSNSVLENQKFVIDSQDAESTKNLILSKMRPLSYLSYGFGVAALAEGHVSAAIYSYDKPWDGAAPSLLIKEAGGKVTDLDGNEQKYNSTINGIVCTNGIIHDQIIKIIKDSK